MIWVLVKYVLSAALRDRLLLGFLFIVGIAISLSIFLGSAAITETDEFSLVFSASSLRLGGVFILVLFTVFHVRRSFETRDVEFLLSRPISRFQFLLAHALAFSVLASCIALLITLALIAMPSRAPLDGLLIWGLSIWVEFVIMVSVALFFAMTLTSAVMATIMSVSFYVLARLMGDILGIIMSEAQSNVAIWMEKIMLGISIFIPRLDLMGQTSWILYGVEDTVNWAFLIIQGVVFCGLIFFAALLDLNRRQF